MPVPRTGRGVRVFLFINLLADDFLQEAYGDDNQADDLERVVSDADRRVQELAQIVENFKKALNNLDLVK